MPPLLMVEHLSISFTQYDRGTHRRVLPAIRDLELTVERGQVAAVVGSSGSGKSLLAHGILGILPYNAHMEGTLIYDGTPLTPERIAALRGREIVLVPQSVGYLDPLRNVGPQVGRDKGVVRSVLNRYGTGDRGALSFPALRRHGPAGPHLHRCGRLPCPGHRR